MVDMVDTTVAPLAAAIKVVVTEDVDPLMAVDVVVSPDEEAVVLAVDLDAVDALPLRLIIRNKHLLTLPVSIPVKLMNITSTNVARYTMETIRNNRNPLSMKSMIILLTSRKNTLSLMSTKDMAITEKTGNPKRLKAMK